MPHLLALPDKFRGSASGAEVAAAMAEGAALAGWTCAQRPVSDGGEGLVDCFGGANRSSVVTGPLRVPVRAAWRLDASTAVLEMAAASGLALVDARNDPVRATTRGTGELIAAALDAGARDIVLGVGGSASTDGGLGAVEVLADRMPLSRLTVAADVSIGFLDAARMFGPQKGADAEQVRALTRRLQRLDHEYLERFGVAVGRLVGSGAGGGLAGGLAALGARIRPGFEVVSEHLKLPALVRAADLVLTGEGRLDATSLLGKAPISVVRLCVQLGTPVLLVVGELADDLRPPVPVVSLTARIGRAAALADPLPAIRDVTAELLARHPVS